jgi:hypothetical protein
MNKSCDKKLGDRSLYYLENAVLYKMFLVSTIVASASHASIPRASNSLKAVVVCPCVNALCYRPLPGRLTLPSLYAILVNEELPYAVRTAAIECIITIYIDCDPHVLEQTTRLARVRPLAIMLRPGRYIGGICDTFPLLAGDVAPCVFSLVRVKINFEVLDKVHMTNVACCVANTGTRCDGLACYPPLPSCGTPLRLGCRG